MNQVNRIANSLFAILFLALLTSCSGSGDSGNGTDPRVGLSPLVLPEQVSVVDPQDPGNSGKPGIARSGDIAPLVLGAVIGDLPAASDYVNDRVSVYVNERSLESFQTVNEILCMVNQSRYDVMLNKGAYRAQVDKNLCSSDRSNAESAGQSSSDQSSGANRPRYEEWIIDSSRASAQAPHIVKVWVHSDPNNPADPEELIHARLVITESADTALPYGVFTLNFKAYIPPDLSTVWFKGFLNAEREPGGRVLLKFASEDKDSFSIDKATLDKNADGSGGSGSVFRAESYPGKDPEATRFNLAYGSTNFLRTDNTGSSVCLDRLTYDVSTWKYALYTNGTPTGAPVGKRVKVNAGFPVRVVSTYGWVGYHGAWFPPGVTLTNGLTVFKHDYTTNADTPFTLVRPGGKLKKYTQKPTTLGGIKGIPLVWWDNTGNTFLVAWDSVTRAFYKLAQLNNNGVWQSITPPTVLDLTALPWVELGFWSQSLGGTVVVKLAPPPSIPIAGSGSYCGYTIGGPNPYDCAAYVTAVNDGIQVVLYLEDIVYPGDPVPAQLACFENCPVASALTTTMPYLPPSVISSYQSGTSPLLATYASYSFSSSTMLLTESATGTPVTTATTTSPYQNGITSGVLFEPTTPNLLALACDWDAGSTCASKARTVLSSFYTWETGPNEWNQFTGLKDAVGNPVRFDRPLQVQYLHSQPSTTAPDYKYNGITFFLEYSGIGDLQGIPGKCVNVDTGLDADCSDGTTDRAIRWVPEFNIPAADGSGNLTEVTNVLQPGISYFVKALEREERMQAAPLLDCNGLTVSAFTLPSMSSWIDPRIGQEPVVNAPPAVIGGVVQ